MDVFRSKKELKDKIEYYLKNPNERDEIAARGYEKVTKYHTYDLRMSEMLDFMEERGLSQEVEKYENENI